MPRCYLRLIALVFATGVLAACGSGNHPTKSGAVTGAIRVVVNTTPTCTTGTETTRSGKYQYGQCQVVLPVPTTTGK